MSNYIYYIFNKPYNVLSQFTKEVPTHVTLKDYLDLPLDIYPIGRLDKDSEGLLLLTNDNELKTKLLKPEKKSPKTYWAQVDGDITPAALEQLRRGVIIKLKRGPYETQPCHVDKIIPHNIEERDPPVRKRASIPTSWIEITIEEGKNRQIRKMCAKVGFPCLRLIRTRIATLKFEDVRRGQHRALTPHEIEILKS
ncbi:MAG: pseudouridine synthase [Bacteroidota bacterium]